MNTFTSCDEVRFAADTANPSPDEAQSKQGPSLKADMAPKKPRWPWVNTVWEAISFKEVRTLKALALPYTTTVYSPGGVQKTLNPKQARKALKQAQTVTLGDLHGSTLKLVETLVLADLVTAPPKAIGKLVQWFKSAEEIIGRDESLMANTVKADLRLIEGYIKETLPQLKWKDPTRQLVLLGDIVADRGPLDSLTLQLIDQFNTGKALPSNTPDPYKHLPIRHLASNHDHTALFQLMGLSTNIDNPTQYASMTRAFQLAGHNQKPLRGAYQRFLQQSDLLLYDPQHQTLRAHGAINKHDLVALTKRLVEERLLPRDWTYETMITPKQVQYFVNEANGYYRSYVERRLIADRLEPKDETLWKQFLWASRPLDRLEEMPLYNKHVQRLLHGHAEASRSSRFAVEQAAHNAPFKVFNLDQQVRKGLNKTEFTTPSYLYID